MNANEQMSQWTKDWALINGAVVCTHCKASQPVTEADDEFQHAAGCSVANCADVHPWVVLHNALDYERG